MGLQGGLVIGDSIGHVSVRSEGLLFDSFCAWVINVTLWVEGLGAVDEGVDWPEQKEEMYELDRVGELVHSTSPQGGGGTRIEPVCTYLKENQIQPQAIIVFTDGYRAGSWGEWRSVSAGRYDGGRLVGPRLAWQAHFESASSYPTAPPH